MLCTYVPLSGSGDFKQLPPATTKQPFICHTSVHGMLDFRVLRENRRVCIDEARARELETFHSALGDVALGLTTEDVKRLVVEAYVRGAHVGCAERAEVDGEHKRVHQETVQGQMEPHSRAKACENAEAHVESQSACAKSGCARQYVVQRQQDPAGPAAFQNAIALEFAHCRGLALDVRNSRPCSPPAHDEGNACV